MQNREKLIYYIETILNIIVAITAIIRPIISLVSNNGNTVLNIVFICVSFLFLLLSIFMMYKLIKKDYISSQLSNIVILAMSILSLVCLVLLIFDFKLIYFIIFSIEFICAIVFKTLALNSNNVRIRYNHVRKTVRKAPTHTIQISTEFLVKESYTPEEAEKTLAQLYSIRDQQGFSMEDYEYIKSKIIKNIRKDG